MNKQARQRVTKQAQRIVIKLGTRVLTDRDGHLNSSRIAELAQDIHAILDEGRQVVLVSSGAVGAGMGQLGLSHRPTDLAHLQAVAAVGQTKLIDQYDRQFQRFGRHAAQVLLTVDDLNNRQRYLNVRNTLLSLLELGTIPVINENDTVAVDELKLTFGDNDRLAAMVASSLRASLLVILSDVAGLFDGDPGAPDAKLVSQVDTLDAATLALARDGKEGISRGGMASKLEAARIVTMAGENVIIASGHEPHVLRRILSGEEIGTLLLAADKSISPWKRWLGLSVQPRGHLVMDAGACHAIVDSGSSLLPIGVQSIHGRFKKGDVVSLRDAQGRELARGLTNYSSADATKIQGRRSEQIADILGHCPYDEMVHRDNLTLTGSPSATP